jgi:hypothetical protein
MQDRHTRQELTDLLNARVDSLTDGRWSIDQLLTRLEEQARRSPEQTRREQERRIELLASVLAIRLSLRRVITVTTPDDLAWGTGQSMRDQLAEMEGDDNGSD